MNREDGAVFFALRDAEQALDKAGVSRASPCDREATAAERVRALVAERDDAKAVNREQSAEAEALAADARVLADRCLGVATWEEAQDAIERRSGAGTSETLVLRSSLANWCTWSMPVC